MIKQILEKITFNIRDGNTSTELKFGACPANVINCCNHSISIDSDNNGIFTISPVCTPDANNNENYCLGWNIENVGVLSI